MKFIIADDHPMVRAGLVQILAGLEDGSVAVEAADYAGARDALGAHPDADLALIDLVMPGMNGMASVADLSTCSPTVPLVVVSASNHPRDIRDALTAGASGFVPKNENPAVLLGALRIVLAGGTYVPPSLASAPADLLTPAPMLTPRQKEVLAMVVAGQSNKEIGRMLGLAEQTVKGHLLMIYRILKVRNRVEAVRSARAIGIG